MGDTSSDGGESIAVSKIYRHVERSDEMMVVYADGALLVLAYGSIIERPTLEEPNVWAQIFPDLTRVSDEPY